MKNKSIKIGDFKYVVSPITKELKIHRSFFNIVCFDIIKALFIVLIVIYIIAIVGDFSYVNKVTVCSMFLIAVVSSSIFSIANYNYIIINEKGLVLLNACHKPISKITKEWAIKTTMDLNNYVHGARYQTDIFRATLNIFVVAENDVYKNLYSYEFDSINGAFLPHSDNDFAKSVINIMEKVTALNDKQSSLISLALNQSELSTNRLMVAEKISIEGGRLKLKWMFLQEIIDNFNKESHSKTDPLKYLNR